ncbi:MAG TPA: GH1 family beta-glucosidase [Polyangiaceae bacterium]|nr:GH1 family beta-glucosidase [Polyangiaceae bacterium]
MSTRPSLSSPFSLGVATSSYQIEGAVNEDGRGPSIWDVFSHTPGKVLGGHTGDRACDHYHLLEQDLELLGWLGVDAYRFSIAWPRVLPNGRGQINSAGLDFYERLVDGLLARGIAPCATLYHWDLPAALPGGWLSRDTVEAFGEYAAVVADRLGDRIAMWLTHNEPWCQAFLGYETGMFAPGHQRLQDALTCAHHLLVSHGVAVNALRSRVKTPVGIALNFLPAHPASSNPEDIAAAERVDSNFNRWFVEPVAGRGYPQPMVDWYGANMPEIRSGDFETIAVPIDVLGVNYYERTVVTHDPAGGSLQRRSVRSELPRTADREIYPPGLSETLRRLHHEYGFQRLVITENGAAFDDELASDGRVHDSGRVQFLESHLREVETLRAEGVPVEGYFAWSLMDNFEWAAGYSLRYGIVHVDFETQKRTPKDSAVYFREVCKQRRP